MIRRTPSGKRESAPSNAAGRSRQQLRIIGGAWRGRHLHFPAVLGLRPTPDRVRETLFNWLQPIIPGARCLDLFAGSGALSFEALSRGAAEAVLVERDAAAAHALQQHVETLRASQARIVPDDALHYLRGTPHPYDVIFLDPPFQDQLLPACVAALAAGGWLAPRAWIYLEADKRTPLPPWPPGWSLHRSKIAGEVGYYLALYSDSELGNSP